MSGVSFISSKKSEQILYITESCKNSRKILIPIQLWKDSLF